MALYWHWNGAYNGAETGNKPPLLEREWAMISVLIPIMPIPPYDSQIKDLLKCLKQQTAEHEVIVCEQKVKRYISKNKLLNEGFAQARGDYIWHCDADFLPEPTLLERMRDKGKDVIHAMIWSDVNGWRIADGAVFMKRKVLERHGLLNETMKGISYSTFPFLEWCLDNTDFYCSDEFILDINKKYGRKSFKGKSDPVTLKVTTPIMVRVMKRLAEKGLVPPTIVRSNIVIRQ